MSDHCSRRRFLAGVSGAILGGTAGCVGFRSTRDETESFARTFDVDDVDALAIALDDGAITVRGTDRDDVRVEGVERAASSSDLEELELVPRRTDGTLRLEPDGPDGSWLGPTPAIDVDVAIPADLRVASLDTTTESVTVQAVRGPLAVDTTTGQVTIEDVDGAVEADVTTGDVTVTDVDGAASVDATTGDVRIDGAAAIDELDVTTGDVRAAVRSLDGDATIESTTGDVSLALAPSLDARVAVDTSTGEVSTGDVSFDDAQYDDDTFSGTLGDGTDRLSISTSTGDVTFSAAE